MRKHLFSLLALSMLMFVASCSDDDKVIKSETNKVTDPVNSKVYEGFFLLNEGQMSMNQATLDFFNYSSGIYTSNIYSEINPGVVKELGDVGNDLKVYDGKLFALINVSGKIEIMDSGNARRIKHINIERCRSIAFNKDKAYVTSWHVSRDGKGLVSEIDLTSLEVKRTIEVGIAPEGLAASGNKLYVANSGGSNYPIYEKSVSIIDLDKFEVEKTIEVNLNPGKVLTDKNGYVFVASQGDYGDAKPKLQQIDQAGKIIWEKEMEVNLAYILDEQLYYVSGQHSGAPSYKVLNLANKTIISENFITAESAKNIITPYGLAVNSENKEVYITDAADFKSNGFVFCFKADGSQKWKTNGGNLPAHIAFLKKNK